jgi:uncharacterized HAD superfamily protein
MKKIGLDIDGVVCNFLEGFYKWFGKEYIPLDSWEDPFIEAHFHQIKDDKYFWLSLQPQINPSIINFPIYCYITARPTKIEYSFKWLENKGFPTAPVFSSGIDGAIHNPKVDLINFLGIEVFVDDKPQHYSEINQYTNAKCFLMNHHTNIHEKVGDDRLMSLADLYHKI